MKIRYSIAGFFCFLLLSTAALASQNSPLISVTGLVSRPLNLSLEDLDRFQTVHVQLNEVMKDKSYRGVFYYQGVPLREILGLASIEKKDTDFPKNIDLAVLIRNRQGREVVLSWGEIFYRNSTDIIIANSASPILPHKDCSSCHETDFYKPYMDVFHRPIGFPKLVVACDAYADRSLEDIVSIQVVNPRPEVPGDRSKKLFSPSFTVTGAVKKDVTVKDLSGYPRREMSITHLGEGKGFHGIQDFSGAVFKSVIRAAGIEPDLCMVFHVSAPDGYRSLFSYGEVFLDKTGDRMFIADTVDGGPIEEGGKFFLIPSDDLMSDRDVKSVEKIEVLSLGKGS
jgi:hypothetical protein